MKFALQSLQDLKWHNITIWPTYDNAFLEDNSFCKMDLIANFGPEMVNISILSASNSWLSWELISNVTGSKTNGEMMMMQFIVHGLKTLLLMWLSSTKHVTWLWCYLPPKAQWRQRQSDSRRSWTMSGLRARNFAFSPEANDPFSLTHLGDYTNLPPMNSTYRSMSGWVFFFYHHPMHFLVIHPYPSPQILTVAISKVSEPKTLTRILDVEWS